MKRVAAILFVTVVAGASCFDPLYEDGAPLTSSWVLCCQSGSVNTCFCEEATSCEQRFFACAGSRCSPTPSCSTGSGGGAGAGGGAGTGGGASGGGGGGIADAGTTADAGVFDGGAGGGSGGGAGGGGGGAASTGFEFCCVLSHVTTCACPSTGCAHEAFTPCPGGACVAGTATALCR